MHGNRAFMGLARAKSRRDMTERVLKRGALNSVMGVVVAWLGPAKQQNANLLQGKERMEKKHRTEIALLASSWKKTGRICYSRKALSYSQVFGAIWSFLPLCFERAKELKWRRRRGSSYEQEKGDDDGGHHFSDGQCSSVQTDTEEGACGYSSTGKAKRLG